MAIKRVYVTGPITGYPDGNKVEFERATKWLREHTTFETVISPLEQDSPEEFAATMADHYGAVYWDRLGEDVKMVQSVDALVLLTGWQRSKGARIEIFVGLSTGKKFYGWNEDVGGVWFGDIDAGTVRYVLSRNMP